MDGVEGDGRIMMAWVMVSGKTFVTLSQQKKLGRAPSTRTRPDIEPDRGLWDDGVEFWVSWSNLIASLVHEEDSSKVNGFKE